jgi:hypothetical protein
MMLSRVHPLTIISISYFIAIAKEYNRIQITPISRAYSAMPIAFFSFSLVNTRAL